MNNIPQTPPVGFVVPATPPIGGNTLAGGSSPGGAPPPSIVTYEDAGDVLQASTTVTSLAVALIALFPSSNTLAKLTVVTLGHWSLSLGFALLFCGLSTPGHTFVPGFVALIRPPALQKSGAYL